MSNLRITPINVWDQLGLLTSTPSFPAASPLSFSQLTARDSVSRASSNGDQVIEGHWNGNGRRLNSFFMFRHNCHGGKLRLQLYSAMDRTGQVYDSGSVEIYTLTSIDSEWGVSPLGFASTDVLGPEAPYYIYFSDTTCLSFKITLTRCQGAYWEIGRFFMGKYLEAPFNPQYGMQFGWQTNTKQARTLGSSLRTRVGERWRELRADMFYATEADLALWRDAMGQIDLAEDVAISIFPGVGGRAERDGVFNAQLQQHSPFVWDNPAFYETVFNFTEL